MAISNIDSRKETLKAVWQVRTGLIYSNLLGVKTACYLWLLAFDLTLFYWRFRSSTYITEVRMAEVKAQTRISTEYPIHISVINVVHFAFTRRKQSHPSEIIQPNP